MDRHTAIPKDFNGGHSPGHTGSVAFAPMRAPLLVSLLFSLAAFGQTKVLFDATKAETAGSADWVIDADQHNLGYNNGPAVVGQGNESNAQRIPTPAQSGISASTSETYWNGGISAWGVDCVNRGYEVETLPYNGSITYGDAANVQDLSNYDVFIVCEPNIRFTAGERDALVHFVFNGGGLFMVSDHDQSDRNGDGWDSPGIWNDLMTNNTVQTDPFGFSLDLQNFSETSTHVANLPTDPLLHGPMGNVTEGQWSAGTSITLHPADNSSVVGEIYRTSSGNSGDNNVLCATAVYGTGRVAVIGDSSPCDDGTGDPNDVLYNGYFTDASGNHRRLLMNATIWLAGSGAEGVRETSEAAACTLYPDPASDRVTLVSPTAMTGTALLRDALGRVVRTWGGLSGERNELSISGCAPGAYHVELILQGSRTVLPLVIQ